MMVLHTVSLQFSTVSGFQAQAKVSEEEESTTWNLLWSHTCLILIRTMAIPPSVLPFLHPPPTSEHLSHSTHLSESHGYQIVSYCIDLGDSKNTLPHEGPPGGLSSWACDSKFSLPRLFPIYLHRGEKGAC